MVDAIKKGSFNVGTKPSVLNKRADKADINHLPFVKNNRSSETEKNQARALDNFTKYENNGQLQYTPEKEGWFWTKEEAHYTYTPDEKRPETFGQLKKNLNLPDGTFAEYLKGYTGNLDSYQIINPVKIPENVLHKSIGW